LTHRFLRETLRLWSPTPIVGRPVRKDLEHAGICLRPGQEYLLSPDILHHDPRLWEDPDTFDPDRWLSGSQRAPRSGAGYVPFGWAPRACIGAGLGTAQLILFCHLLCNRFRIEGIDPQKLSMAMPSMPVPQNLCGTLSRVSEVSNAISESQKEGGEKKWQK
jgi:cytochrome P450